MPVLFSLGKVVPKLIFLVLEKMATKEFILCQQTCRHIFSISQNRRDAPRPIPNYILIFQDKDPHGLTTIRIAVHKNPIGVKVKEVFENEARLFFESVRLFSVRKICLSGGYPSSQELELFVKHRLNRLQIHCQELEILITGRIENELLQPFLFKEITTSMNCKLESLIHCSKITDHPSIKIKNIKIMPDNLFDQVKSMRIVRIETNSTLDPLYMQTVIKAMKKAKNFLLKELEIHSYSCIAPLYKEGNGVTLIHGRNTRPSSIYLVESETGILSISVVEYENRDVMQILAVHKNMKELYHHLVNGLKLDKEKIKPYEETYIKAMEKGPVRHLEAIVAKMCQFRIINIK